MADVMILTGDKKGQTSHRAFNWLDACAIARKESYSYPCVAIDGNKKAVFDDGVCIRAYPRTVEIA